MCKYIVEEYKESFSDSYRSDPRSNLISVYFRYIFLLYMSICISTTPVRITSRSPRTAVSGIILRKVETEGKTIYIGRKMLVNAIVNGVQSTVSNSAREGCAEK